MTCYLLQNDHDKIDDNDHDLMTFISIKTAGLAKYTNIFVNKTSSFDQLRLEFKVSQMDLIRLIKTTI
jgi:hypothetical protein